MTKSLTAAGEKNRGPWWHRVSIRLCTLILFVLVYQALGFLTDDIWRVAGPDYQRLENENQEIPPLLAKQTEVQAQIDKLQRVIRDNRISQTELREITTTSQETWKQLQEFRKLSLEKEKELSPSEQQALDDARTLFLKSQQNGLELQAEVSETSRREAGLKDQLGDLETSLRRERAKVNDQYAALLNRHRIFLGSMQLLVLIPLMVAAGFLFFRLRHSTWLPFAQAFGGAVILKVIVLMHSYFPIDLLVYPLVATGLIVVGAMLWGLIRIVSRPNLPWLLGQYRDAYQSFLCPVCDYPIRRGPLKYLFWNRKSLKRLHVPPQSATPADENYTCPCCATALFEECIVCHGTRHSLLPACNACGAVKEIPTPP